MTAPTIRTDWTREEIAALFDLPFMDLMYEAQTVHRAYHPRNEVQLSTLLSIKTGGCPEDCGYCSQSVEADSGVKATKLMDVRRFCRRRRRRRTMDRGASAWARRGATPRSGTCPRWSR
jgi:biotin synthase